MNKAQVLAPHPAPAPLAGALERVKLHQKVLARVAASGLVRQGQVSALCRLVTQEASETLGIERVSVWFFNDRYDELLLEDLYLRSTSEHVHEGVLSQVAFADEFAYLLTEKFVDAHDPYTDPRTQGYADSYLRPNRITSMLDAVMRIGDELLGAFCLEHVDKPHQWDETEIVFCSQLGDQLSLAVSMARMHAVAAQLRQRDTELQVANAQLARRVQESARDLESAQAALIASARLASLGEIVAGVAHDLSTPVGNALLLANTLRERCRDLQPMLDSGKLQRSALQAYLDDQSQAADLIERSLQRASQLVSAFKSVTADQASGARRPLRLDELVRDVVDMLTPSLKRSSCQVQVEQDIAPDLRLDSFPGALDQVLVNLINNAVLHGFEGRERGCIRLEAQAAGEGMVRLRVQDDGCGIPEADRERVFERFFTTKRGLGGSGLGLNLVHSIVTLQLGGEVQLHSHSGDGCTIDLLLPLVAPD
jgi:signal transduction histidine kinase